jgi:hypothetical protein
VARAIAVVALLAASVACTGASPSTSQPSPTWAPPTEQISRIIALEDGQSRLNLKRSEVRPGDQVTCDGRTIAVPRRGVHKGQSGALWVYTDSGGRVSMGCGTRVVFGTATNTL